MSGTLGSLFRSNSKVTARAAGVNLNTSVYGKPIPIVYGTTRMASNLLLYGNFSAQGQASAGGGKGGGNASGASGYTYAASAAFALCEGPITGIGTVWRDNTEQLTLSGPGGILFSGTFPQTAWNEAISWSYQNASGSTITGSLTTMLGYNGIAYAAFADLGLNSSPDLPNFEYEVQGILAGTASPVSTSDADPSQILSDFLTSSHHGLGLPAAKLGSLTTYQSYCMAAGLVVSPNYDSQRTGADVLDELALATNSAPVWTGGLFRFVPYGDTALSANGFTYTPSTAIYFLTDSDYIKSPQGGGQLSGGAIAPVVLERKRASDKTNSLEVEFLDRSNAYAPSIAYANDQGLIDAFGLRSQGSKQMHLFCLASAANLSAHLQLRRLARISNYYYFDLDQRYILLDPMDIIAISDSNLGLVNQLVRITEIDENDDGTLSFTCEEYLGTQGQPSFNFGTGAGFNRNPNTAAQTVNTPIVFEPPSALLGGQGTNPEVWIAACGGSTVATDLNWGGANVWLATPGSLITYQQIGTITSPARMGFATAVLPAHTGTNPDSTGVLTIDLTESGGQLNSGSTADAQVANTLCLVDGELLSYTLATLVGGNTYNLTGLYRGLYGTGNVSHNPGAPFARLDGAIFKYTLNPTYVNQPLLIKLQSLNVFGQGVQPLSSATTYEYVPAGTALLHPLGQALNITAADSGVLTSGNAAVFEDYGYISSPVPGGTLYHMPIGTDLGSLGGAFSIQLPQGTGYALVLGNNSINASARPRDGFNGSTNVSGKGTWATWFNRLNSGDSLPQMIMGVVSAASTATSTSNNAVGNLFIGISTANNLIVVGQLNNGLSVSNWNAHGVTVTYVSTVVSLTSTATITSSGWHHVTLAIFASTSTGVNFLTLYLDDSSVARLTLSDGLNFPGLADLNSFGGPVYLSGRMIGVSTTSTFAHSLLPSGWNNFDGYLAETYFIDGQTLTSTSFTASSVGPPLTFASSMFIGNADAYFNYGNPLGIGLDQSGKNNSMFASTLVTSTFITLQYP